MDEKETLRKNCIKALNEALNVCPPDEYQYRHNLLIRQLAAYVLIDDIMELEEEI